MELNEYGKIVENEILKKEKIRKEIKIDEYIIMPKHIIPKTYCLNKQENILIIGCYNDFNV